MTSAQRNLPEAGNALIQAKVMEERKGLFWAVFKDAVEFGVSYSRNTSCTQIGRSIWSKYNKKCMLILNWKG
jgi:hypothetical protein